MLAIWFAITGSKKVIFPIPVINKEKIDYIKKIIEAGAFTPVIDIVYPLESIADAARYVDTGRKTGNVVIQIAK